jgi:hypothetical protein
LKTNRKWLQGMALSDMLNLIIQHSDQCVLSVLGCPEDSERCNRVWQEDKSINENCYNCVCSWLNEQHKNFFQKHLDKSQIV